MPKWSDLKRYCEKNGWELYKKTDHFFYRKKLSDGTLLRTKVSMGTGEIKKHLWKEILRHQLRITNEEFNRKL